MDYLPEKGYRRILVLTFYGVLGLVLLYIFVKYLLRILLPFIVAFIISAAIRPMAAILHKRTRVPIKVISVVLVLMLLAFLGFFLFVAADKLLYELKGIVGYINDNADRSIHQILDAVNGVLERIPFLKTFGSEQEMLDGFATIGKDLLSQMTANMPEMLARAIAVLPNMLFVTLVLIMASYYFCADYNEITAYFSSKLPQGVRRTARLGIARIKGAARSVVKGYLLTIGITFIQLYVGFLIIGTEYAMTIALITALVDILPIIGVGTVLIPWAIVKLIMGNNYQAFGLLIIFAIVSVVREVLEPKIIGKSIGLHPLATLLSMYIGLETCGFLGMIFFPVLVIGLKTAASIGIADIKEKEKKP